MANPGLFGSAKWPQMDKTERNRLNTVLLGIKNTCIDAVKEYNARSTMVNRNIFKEDVPVVISMEVCE